MQGNARWLLRLTAFTHVSNGCAQAISELPCFWLVTWLPRSREPVGFGWSQWRLRQMSGFYAEEMGIILKGTERKIIVISTSRKP